jgi:hypothetical protein
MTAIQAIGPILLLIALMPPIIKGYRREKLATSIRIGWALIVLTYLSIDLLIPALAYHFYGREGLREVASGNAYTMAALMFGWLFPLILHCGGFILHDLVEVLRGLLSKSRHR